MKLFVVLLCSILVAQGLRIFKKELRSLHQVEKNKIIAKTIIGDFNGIYQEIHNAAKQGKNETRIALRCSYTLGMANVSRTAIMICYTKWTMCNRNFLINFIRIYCYEKSIKPFRILGLHK